MNDNGAKGRGQFETLYIAQIDLNCFIARATAERPKPKTQQSWEILG